MKGHMPLKSITLGKAKIGSPPTPGGRGYYQLISWVDHIFTGVFPEVDQYFPGGGGSNFFWRVDHFFIDNRTYVSPPHVIIALERIKMGTRAGSLLQLQKLPGGNPVS